MNASDAQTTISTVLESGQRQSILLLGPPGVGKTTIVAKCAEKSKLPLTTIPLPTCEAVDLRGLPYVDGGVTRWASPLPRAGVLLLDEVSSAPPDVQVAAHHIVWTETGSDMHTDCHVILTGNRATDRTIFRATSGPLRNRLLILNLDPDLDTWIAWAKTADIAPAILGFLRWRPKLLYADEVPAEGAFPSPRSWAMASRLISLSLTASNERECLVGTVGNGAAVEFSAYLRTARELPAVESLLKSPTGAKVPSEPSVLYALVSALAHHTRQNNVGAMSYCRRLPAEFALLYVREIRDRYDISRDPDIRAWIAEHPRLFEGAS